MAGRTKKSCVWNYFKYDKEANRSTCQVVATKNEEAVTCGKELSGMFASNLKKHLKNQHPEAFGKFEEEARRPIVKAKRSFACQASSSEQTLEATMPKWYPQDSKRAQSITKKLALFIEATSAPLSLVDYPEFQDLLHEMDRQYKIPLRHQLGKDIEKLYSDLKVKLSDVIKNARKISLCCDVWSKQGMTASFLGVTVHCFHLLTRNDTTSLYQSNDLNNHTLVCESQPCFKKLLTSGKFPNKKYFDL